MAAPTNISPIPFRAAFNRKVLDFELEDIDVDNGTPGGLSPLTDRVYDFTVTPTQDGPVTVQIPAGVCRDEAGKGNQASPPLSIVYDSTPPVIPDGTITPSNQTASTADFAWAKASDAITDAGKLIYKLYRALEDPDDIDASNLTTLAEIDSNGELVAEGTDVASLSEDGTNIVTDRFYKYNVTVEDEAGNRALYSQVIFHYQSAVVHSVSINEDFDYVDQADGTVQLQAEIDATNVDDLTFSWSSSNTEIATVEASGSTVTVTFLATGKVTITVESNFDNSKKDTITFTIWEFSPSGEATTFETQAA